MSPRSTSVTRTGGRRHRRRPDPGRRPTARGGRRRPPRRRAPAARDARPRSGRRLDRRRRLPELAPPRPRGRAGDRHRPQRPVVRGLPRRRAHRDGRRQHELCRSGRHARHPSTPSRRPGTTSSATQTAGVSAWQSGYYDLPLQKPADGVTPVGEAYTYSANDASVADVDGDGAYEFVVKWDPSNSKDVSQKGYTGPVYLDTYELDGTLLNRLDLGVNIRAGAHYTRVHGLRLRRRRPVRDDAEDRARARSRSRTAPDGSHPQRGVRHACRRPTSTPATRTTDDYRLSAADYRDAPDRGVPGLDRAPRGRRRALARDSRGGLGHPGDARVSAVRRRRGGADRLLHSTSTRRRAAPATSCASSRASSSTVRSTSRCSTRRPARSSRPCRTSRDAVTTDCCGATTRMARIEPGNRVDRFLAGVAYLDGQHPSAIFARGYYTRSTVAAYDWDGEHLSTRWFVDSGHVPMTNPFNDTPHGRDGTDPGLRHAHHAGLPLAERGRRGRRRQARDRLRLGHDRR